jgi:hypothetical protein
MIYVIYDRVSKQLDFSSCSSHRDSAIRKFYESHRIYFEDMGYRDKPNEAYAVIEYIPIEKKGEIEELNLITENSVLHDKLNRIRDKLNVIKDIIEQ